MRESMEHRPKIPAPDIDNQTEINEFSDLARETGAHFVVVGIEGSAFFLDPTKVDQRANDIDKRLDEAEIEKTKQ